MERRRKKQSRQEVPTFDRAWAQYQIRELLREQLKTSALKLVLRLFEEEVEDLCGPRYSREHPGPHRRGGSVDQSVVHVAGQRVQVKRPRVRKDDEEHVLKTYRALQSYDVLNDAVLKKMIRGVSTRDYSDTVEEISGGLGLSKSTVSRSFVRASQKDLNELNSRDLSKHLFVALYFDGIDFAGINLIVGMGITSKGKKVILGLVEGHTENAELCIQLLESIQERGLAIPKRILVTIDGSKALRSAVKRIFGDRAVVHRCQQHKIRNVLRHLPKGRHTEVRRRLSMAYNLENYEEAKDVLKNTVSYLRQVSDAAASSLQEGLEETLTVVRLGLPATLRRTLATTNPLESIFDGVRHRSRNVKRWRRGRHASRWAASGLLFMEKRLNRIQGHKSLSVLIAALNDSNKDVDVKEATG